MKALLRLLLLGVAVACTLLNVASAQDVFRLPNPEATDNVGRPFLTQINPFFPGRMWFGYTGVNEGLGYGTGSYFTIGGKMPIGDDYFGGRWLLETRGHLAHEQGQFFGNIGIERVFTIDPANADVGVGFWYDVDKDGEKLFGHNFQQLGVSGFLRHENFVLRSNGYFPIGDTEHLIGDPTLTTNSCFFQNTILLQPGIDTALEGFDVELRVFPRIFEMVQGSIDFGFYYYRDADVARTAVESFAGGRVRATIHTMRGIELQAELNEDDRFGTTGFLRVVVSSDVFAPAGPLGQDLDRTMRNDHVARVNQAPVFVIDPATGAPYRFVHVDSNNTDPSGGDGTFENPFTTLAAADGTTGGSRPGDIIFVREGAAVPGIDTGVPVVPPTVPPTNVILSPPAPFNTVPYNETIALLDRQQLLGDGVRHFLPVAGGGRFLLCNDLDDNQPTINGVVLANDVTVRGFNITPPAGGTAVLANNLPGNTLTILDQLNINGNAFGGFVQNPGPPPTIDPILTPTGSNGYSLTNVGGRYLIFDSDLSNTCGCDVTGLTGTSLFINSAVANLDVDFNCNITSASPAATAVNVSNLAGTGTVDLVNGTVNVTGGRGFVANNVGGTVNVTSPFTQDGGTSAIDVQNSTGMITFASGTIGAVADVTGTAINIVGGTVTFTYNGSATKTNAGFLVNIDGVGETGPPATIAGNIDFVNGTLIAEDASNGINIANLSGGTTVDFADVDIGLGLVVGPITNDAVTLNNNNDALGGNGVITFTALDIITDGGVGVLATNGGTLNVGTGNVTTLSTASTPAGTSAGALAINISGTTAGAANANFTSVNADNTAGGGVNLVGNMGTWNLGSVNIRNDNGTGFNASAAGTVNVNTGTINTTTGAGLVANGGTLFNANFSNISTTNSPGAAISLSGLANTSSFTVSGGTLDTPGGNAIDINNNNTAGADLATFSISNMVINFGTIDNLQGIRVDAGTGAVTVANNSIDLAGTVGAEGIFIQGNDGFDTMNLGTGVSFSNTVLNVTGAGSTPIQFNLGVNITGNIQVNGLIFTP